MSMAMLDINNEIRKSIKSINYSQWERTEKPSSSSLSSSSKEKKSTGGGSKSKRHSSSATTTTKTRSTSHLKQTTTAAAKSTNHSCFSTHNHNHNHNHNQNGGAKNSNSNSNNSSSSSSSSTAADQFGKPKKQHIFKTKRQMQEEENRKEILKIKLQFTREYLDSLHKRERELFEMNQEILRTIEQKEKVTNLKVDTILRKYDKYQNVKKNIKEKHSEELLQAKHDLNLQQKEVEIDLAQIRSQSDELEDRLLDAKELCQHLMLYKNQEHPEKQLQISNLKKKLQDMTNIHNEEYNSLLDMLNHEKSVLHEYQMEEARQIAEKVSLNSMGQMHESLKDMAEYNESMKDEIKFYKLLNKDLHKEVEQSRDELQVLKKDERRNVKQVIFSDIFAKKEKCTPDMEVDLKLSARKIAIN